MPNYKISTSSKDFELSSDQLNSLDFNQISENQYQIIENEKVFHVEVVGLEGKEVSLRINGREETVLIKDELDMLVDKMGLSAVVAERADKVEAPMPGLVLKLMVEPGDAVVEGQGLLILEAMKMENVIKAPADAVVKSVEVEVGEAVEKKKVIIYFE